MMDIELPWFNEDELTSQEYLYSFNRPRRLPLVAWTGRLSKRKKQELQLLCGLNEFPFVQLTGNNPIKLDMELEKAWKKVESPSVILVGDYLEFPPMKFRTQFGVHYSDYIYGDIGNEGEFDVGIGRVFGSVDTIAKHLRIKIGDSNQAVLFDSSPDRSSEAINAIKSLGLELQVLKKYEPQHKSVLENAEFILQVSDGLMDERIHGSPMQWASSSGSILHYKDMANLHFKNYPLIFAESCSTAGFGPLLYYALKNGAMYYGATSPSINNPKEFQSWHSCAFADGVKIGLLDMMDEVRTIGEVQMAINKELQGNLSSTHKSIMQNAMKNAVQGLDISDPEIATLLQFNLFGNPERPVVVGIKPDYDAKVVHFDT